MSKEKLYTLEDMDRSYETGRRNGNAEDHNLYASKETKELFAKLDKKTEEIHAAIFGVDCVGGIVKTIERIEGQTMTTNGRVKKLEMWRFGLTMCGVLITMIVIPLITFIFFDKINQLNEKIDFNVVATTTEK
jgi:hypothetical protein